MLRRGFDLSTPKPCSQDWEAMSGDSRQRHCAECATTVHNLARMSRREVELLAMRSAAGDEVCARVTRDANGEVVMQADSRQARSLHPGSILLSAALAAGLPVAAQTSAAELKTGTVSSGDTKSVARVTGRLLKPDGSPVDTGLIYLAAEGGGGQWYVADSIGSFEFRVPPGRYEFGVQTGPQEAQRMSSVVLHEGEQSFGDVRTQAGRGDLAMMSDYSMMGEVASKVSWSWRGRLRHPVLFLRSVARKLS